MTQKDKDRMKSAEEPTQEMWIQANMINQAVRLYEAADLLVRMYEKRIRKSNMGLKHENKRMFDLMRKDIQHLKYHMEQFATMYYDAYEDRTFSKMEDFQNAGFIYASLALIMGDGCDTNEKVQDILNTAMKYSEGRSVTQELIEYIKPITKL